MLNMGASSALPSHVGEKRIYIPDTMVDVIKSDEQKETFGIEGQQLVTKQKRQSEQPRS